MKLMQQGHASVTILLKAAQQRWANKACKQAGSLARVLLSSSGA